MELCLVRHAIAVERGSKGYQDDRARPLTPEGRKRMAQAALGLKSLVQPEAVLTSPLLRAKQTADILGDTFGLKPRVLEALGTGDHAATLAGCGGSGARCVMLVGHEPWMSELLSVLLTGHGDGMSSVFRKGAAALVTTRGAAAAGAGTLEWLLQPSVLRGLGKRN